jgi:hypothetical protein
VQDKAYAKKFEFRPLDKERRGGAWRIWSVARFNLVHQWTRSRFLKLVMVFIILILILSNLMLLSSIDMLLETFTPNEVLENHLWGTFRKFVRFQVLIASPSELNPVFDTGYSIFMLIGFIMMGSGLISDDLQHQALELYDTKISRIDYLLGKYGALLLFGNVLFTLPCVCEWFLIIIGVPGVDIIQAIPVLLGVIIFTEALTLILTSIILTFSSLTHKRLFAGVFTFGFLLLTSKVTSALIGLPEIFSPLMYLDLFTVLSVFSYLITGETSVNYYDTTINGVDFTYLIDLTGLAGSFVIPFIIFFLLLSFLICFYRLVWYNSHPFYFWQLIRHEKDKGDILNEPKGNS